MIFSDFRSVERYLNSLINYEHTFPLGGQRAWPKLGPTLHAVERLGLSLRLPRCIHIAGTKGKGSTLSFLEALLAPDMPVLSFSSPHLTSVKERVRYGGQLLDDELWQRGFEQIVTMITAEPAIRLSYFETTWIFYLWAARELGTAAHIAEAGLGGRWDATNTLKETLPVLTPVDYDHTEVLGRTLTQIATDKGGIIKPGSQVVIGKQPPEALQVYRRLVDEQDAAGSWFGIDYRWSEEEESSFRYEDAHVRVPGLALAVSGLHQRDNAALAIRAATMIYDGLTPDAICARLRTCVIPGRQQLFRGTPDILVDVAHNPISFRVLGATLRTEYAGRRILAVMGIMKDKDARGSLEEIRDTVKDALIVPLSSPRTAAPADLSAIAESLGMRTMLPPTLEAAFTRLHEPGYHDLGLIAGSFYLAGDYLNWRQRAGIA